jgi:hypothetical protein
MANEILKRNPTSTGNRRVFTWAGWVKINQPSSTTNCIWYVASAGNSEFNISIGSGTINVYDYAPSAYQYQYITSRLLRDFSNWFHLVVAVDTTQVREDDRFKIYINGSLYNGSYSTEVTAGGINYNTRMNTLGEINYIGQNVAGGSSYSANCELTDLFMIDGQALTPDVFGFYKVGKGYISAGSAQATDFRPGQWVPKTPRVIKTAINNNGGFGVNGFYLPMNDSNNFGADFHGTPNSIIKLQENLPQPRCRIDGVGDYTGALRDDPFKQYLVLALPFVSGGLSSGFGDYSAAIRGYGSQINPTFNGTNNIESISGYYGSAARMNGANGILIGWGTNDPKLNFGSGDWTMEAWVYTNSTPSAYWSILRSKNYNDTTSSGIAFYGYQGSIIIWKYEAGYVQLYPSTVGTIPNQQWTHVVLEKNQGFLTTYVNGVSVATVDNSSSSYVNNGFEIGQNYDWDGYIQDLRIYKGVAKYTGGFDVPKPYTPVGIATWRAVPDTTANNFATLNPLAVGEGGQTYSEGNLKFVADSSSAWHGTVSTIGVSTGKWYVELLPTSVNAGYVAGVPMTQSPRHPGTGSFGDAESDTGIGFALNGSVYTQGSATNKTNSGYSQGDYIGLALDLDNRTVDIYTNGSDIGGATSIDEGTYYFGSGSYTQSTTIYNFGQNPTFSGNTTAGTFTDSNSKGLFKYEPPSGFLALCEDNLPTPAISDPGEYFRTVLYTGDSNAGRSIVGVGFTPDLVWVKHRNTAGGHGWFDSVRGPGLRLDSQSTGAETSATGVMSFDSDGFSLGSTFNTTNIHTVAWCWKAGGAAVSNTDGSITSVVSVNQDAGFSIVSYTGNGTSSQTVGHGLGVAPSMVIVKNRDRVASWIVRHSSLPANQTPLLENTVGYITTNYWESTYPSSTVFTISNNSEANANNENLIAYCFSEVAGYNKFGSYTGNGSTDGPFVFTNGKPAFVMIKRTDSTGDWYLFDSSRNSSNPVSLGLLSNTTQIDGDYTGWGDFLSNGFKIRRTDGAWNASGGTYIFACWMESPFTTANSK